MVAKCKVNRAAQGLFYSGIIHNEYGRNFSFVNDCGTDSAGCAGNKAILYASIDAFKTHIDGKLDLLMISHFHRDHISGIPELLRGVKVKTVIMPYIGDFERILYMASFDAELTDGEFSLLEDPISYFRERGAETIIIMGGPEDMDDPEYRSTPIDLGPIDSETFTFKSPHVGYHIEKGSTDGTPSTKCYYFPRETHLLTKQGWEFLVFCDPNAIKSLSAFHTEIDTLTKGDIKSYISNFRYNKLKEIKKIYEKYKVKHCLNQQSLVVISRPTSISVCSSSAVISGWKFTSQSCSTVLTGDISFSCSSLARQFLVKNLTKDEALVVILPHHGSRNGLCKAVMPNFHDSMLFVASFGEKRVSSRNHPHMDHLRNVIGKAFFFIPVNDSNDFFYEIDSR
jgi:hypothetical protein